MKSKRPSKRNVKESPNSLHDLFISYSHKDQSFVGLLIELFQRADLRCFQDISGIQFFEKLDAKLKTVISQCRWVMAIISPSYLRSYWCLFEAMEAIQGQDREQRFLPIVIRYSPSDQLLDEEFVLKALHDLDTQMNEFESKMVRLKAYELVPRLEKLRFARQQLPLVFRQITERIYPEFTLWDEESVRDSLRKLLALVAPNSKIPIQTLPLNFKHLSPTPVVIPQLRALPSLIWKAKIGCHAWKNMPILVGNDVFIGTAGNEWNKPDEGDGIYCLKAETGEIKWFAPTSADANSVLVSKGIALTGCDDGVATAVSARDGSPIWQNKLDSGIIGGPIKLHANNADSMPSRPVGGYPDPVLFASYFGTLYLLDLKTGQKMTSLELGHRVISAPLVYRWFPSHIILIATLDAKLIFVEYSDCSSFLSVRYTVDLSDQLPLDGKFCKFSSQPRFVNGLIVQGFVRNSYYRDPPIFALDAESRKIRWFAANQIDSTENFENIRGTPTIVNNELIFATAYSRKIGGVSLETGQLLWTVDLGQEMFEQWSSPIVDGSAVYLGRHDGYIHKISTERRTREWSMYLGDSNHAGVAIDSNQEIPEYDSGAGWAAGGSSPVLASPVIDRGRLYCGTHEGYLYCVGNLGAA